MIRILNLVNGEQIIGDVEEYSARCRIINPFYIVDAVNEEGSIGSKLTNVLTFSPSDYIEIDHSKIVFSFPASASMGSYYKKLVALHDKKLADEIISEALNEMDQSERRYQKLMEMIRPDKSKLN